MRPCVTNTRAYPSLAGLIGKFDFPTLLISLVSSVTLLAIAKTVVEFLAFSILPLKFIYRQYRNIDVRAAAADVWSPAFDASLMNWCRCVNGAVLFSRRLVTG